MYNNKQLKTLLQSKRRRADALKKRANKGVIIDKKMNNQIITENIKNTKALKGGSAEVLKHYMNDMSELGYEIQDAKDENRKGDLESLQNERVRLRTKIAMLNRKMGKGGSCCGGNVGRKRNKVMVSDTTQKLFNPVYNAKKPLARWTAFNVRGGAYSLPVGDVISNEQHRGIVEAQQKYADAWRRRNKYASF